MNLKRAKYIMEIHESGGCMLCPLVFVRSNPSISGKNVFYRVKNEKSTRHFYACYRKGKYLPRYMLAFIEMIQQATAKSAAPDQQIVHSSQDST